MAFPPPQLPTAPLDEQIDNGPVLGVAGVLQGGAALASAGVGSNPSSSSFFHDLEFALSGSDRQGFWLPLGFHGLSEQELNIFDCPCASAHDRGPRRGCGDRWHPPLP